MLVCAQYALSGSGLWLREQARKYGGPLYSFCPHIPRICSRDGPRGSSVTGVRVDSNRYFHISSFLRPRNMPQKTTKTPKQSSKAKQVPKLIIQEDENQAEDRPETTSTPRSPIPEGGVSAAEFREFKRLLAEKEAENARLYKELTESRAASKKKRLAVSSVDLHSVDSTVAGSSAVNYMLSLAEFGLSDEEDVEDSSFSQLKSAVKAKKSGDGILKDSSAFAVSEAAVFAELHEHFSELSSSILMVLRPFLNSSVKNWHEKLQMLARKITIMKRSHAKSSSKSDNNLFVLEQIVEFLDDWFEKYNFTSATPYCTASIIRFLSSKVSIAILGSNTVTCIASELKSTSATNRVIREASWASLLSWRSKSDYSRMRGKTSGKGSGKRKWSDSSRRDGQGSSKSSSKSGQGSQF